MLLKGRGGGRVVGLQLVSGGGLLLAECGLSLLLGREEASPQVGAENLHGPPLVEQSRVLEAGSPIQLWESGVHADPMQAARGLQQGAGLRRVEDGHEVGLRHPPVVAIAPCAVVGVHMSMQECWGSWGTRREEERSNLPPYPPWSG